MVERLLGRQLRDRREHALGVAGQEHEVLRVAGAPLGDGVADEGERVRGAGVLGQAVVVEVDRARDRVEDDVLENRPEAVRRRVDLGLRGGGEADHLRVAAVLDVEDTLVAPPVLVVADQAARGVGREGRLAGAGEAEEERRVAVRADVRGAVHAQHAVEREQVVEQCEDRLLHLARVRGAADHAEPALEVDHDEGRRPCPVGRLVGLERRGADERELGHVLAVRLPVGKRLEHVAGEEAVPAELGDDPDRQAVLGLAR